MARNKKKTKTPTPSTSPAPRPQAAQMAEERATGAAPTNGTGGGADAKKAEANFSENISLLQKNPKEVAPVFGSFLKALDKMASGGQEGPTAQTAPSAPTAPRPPQPPTGAPAPAPVAPAGTP